MNLKPLLIALGCLLYTISPIDVLPEAALGPFGLPDDVIAVLIGVRQAFKAFRPKPSTQPRLNHE